MCLCVCVHVCVRVCVCLCSCVYVCNYNNNVVFELTKLKAHYFMHTQFTPATSLSHTKYIQEYGCQVRMVERPNVRFAHKQSPPTNTTGGCGG